MEYLLKILLFGKQSEKWNIIYMVYLVFIAIWITNKILLSFNFNVLVDMNFGKIIEIFLSPVGIMGIAVFLFFAIVLSVYGKILIILISPIIPILFQIFSFLISLIKNSLRFVFRRNPRKIREWIINENDILEIIKMAEKWKINVLTILNIDGSIIDSSSKIFSFFLSTLIVFTIYNIQDISPIIYNLIKWLSVFYLINGSFIYYLITKKEVLKILYNKSLIDEPNRDNQ